MATTVIMEDQPHLFAWTAPQPSESKAWMTAGPRRMPRCIDQLTT